MADFYVPPFRPLEVEGSLEDLERGRVAMSVNAPRPADDGTCVIDGPVTVRGWAHARGGIEAVFVIVDGKPYEALRPVVRTDLLDYYGADAATDAGFVLRLHPSECPAGAHDLTIVAVGCEGDAVGVEAEVICRLDPHDSDAPPDPAPTVDWIEERTTPRPNPGSADPYDPERDAATAWEAEHQLPYRWAAELAVGQDVLDVSCGLGWGVTHLAEAAARRVVGLGQSPESLAQARRRVDVAGVNVELMLAETTTLPFDERTFDLITWFEAAEHAGHSGRVVGELRRVLRPDGFLLVAADEHPERDELESTLKRSFAHVQIYRQHTSLASVLLKEVAASAVEGRSSPGQPTVRQLSAEPPQGDRGRLVAVAGDTPPPDPEQVVTFAPPEAIRRLHGLALMWESRALLAEADAAASRIEAGLASTQQEVALQMLRANEARLRSVGHELS